MWVIVEEFVHSIIIFTFGSQNVKGNVNHLVGHIYWAVVQIVGHWNHRSRLQPPSKASRANLRVNIRKQCLINKFGGKDLWILFKHLFELYPIKWKFSFIFCELNTNIFILEHFNNMFLPITRKINIWHHPEIRIPVTLFAFCHLIKDK